jgi:hypothetical protein
MCMCAYVYYCDSPDLAWTGLLETVKVCLCMLVHIYFYTVVRIDIHSSEVMVHVRSTKLYLMLCTTRRT